MNKRLRLRGQGSVLLVFLAFACVTRARAAPVCGNGVIEAPEACDDGNVKDGDGCTPRCDIQGVAWICHGEPSVCFKSTNAPTPKPKQTLQTMLKPTSKPTARPTKKLTSKPTSKPTLRPTSRPTLKTTSKPTLRPTSRPTLKTTSKPTGMPSSTATAIAAGHSHTCVLLDDGTVKCFGANGFGQLGQGNTNTIGDDSNEMGNNLKAISLGAGRTATAIATGGHTCALLDDGTVKCFGYNWYGQLGQGNTANTGDDPHEMGNNLKPISLGARRTATAIAAGDNHSCALLDNGTVKCFGANYYGQLGQGSTDSIGRNLNEMGNNLKAISLGAGRTATAIAAGYYHTCALLDNGTVKCFGYNQYGQLGQGNTDNIGDLPNEMGDNLPAISLGAGRTATAIAAGFAHTCALLDNGTVKCFGVNWSGQLGQGNTNTIGNNPNEMGNNLKAISLGAGRTATAIAAGENHTCVLLDNGTVKCFGSNFYGELGQGNTASIGNKPQEMGDNLPAISLGAGRTATAITADGYHTCVLLDDGTVKCFGENLAGQLGQGNTRNIGDNPQEMGNNLKAISL